MSMNGDRVLLCVASEPITHTASSEQCLRQALAKEVEFHDLLWKAAEGL